jgi:hypothetical protein
VEYARRGGVRESWLAVVRKARELLARDEEIDAAAERGERSDDAVDCGDAGTVADIERERG